MRTTFWMAAVLASLALSGGTPAMAHTHEAAPVLPVGDQVIENGEFTITEPIVMAPGSSLTIRNAKVWLDFPTVCPTRGSAGYCQPQIMLNGATLRVQSSTLDTHNHVPGNVESMYMIAAVGGRVELTDSTFRHLRLMSVQGGGGAPSSVTGSHFVDSFQTLLFSRGSGARIEGNTFERSVYGVAVRDTSATVRGNVFRDIGSAGEFGRAIDVQATLAGTGVWQTRPVVEDNLVEDSHQALLSLNSFPTVIRNNVFRRNVYGSTLGVNVGDAQPVHVPVFEHNLLEENETAVTVYASGTSQNLTLVEVDLRDNALVETGCVDVDVLMRSDNIEVSADARGNWWGDEDGPVDRTEECPATRGRVLTTPWLRSAPG